MQKTMQPALYKGAINFSEHKSGQCSEKVKRDEGESMTLMVNVE